MKKETKGGTALVPSPVILLSVKGRDTPNIITLSWAANVCSNPPSVAVGIRPNRHSYELVKEAGEFVVNIPSLDQFEAAKFCGSKSGRDYDKFAECNFTAVQASKVDAPMIAECPINLECKTSQIISVGVHDLFIAEVLAVHIDDSILDEKGKVDVAKAKLFTYIPLTGQYWAVDKNL
ncbi:MAG: flavin reductase family protein [Candidatus Thorarchaeota archaeon]